MIVSTIFSDFDSIFSLILFHGVIFSLISEIPVRQIDPTIRTEEAFEIVKHHFSISGKIQMMKGGKEEDGIKKIPISCPIDDF